MADLTPLQTPSGTINVCWQVPLDNSYTNTIWFEEERQQIQYFKSMIKPHPNGGLWSFTNQTYSRLTKNSVRVNGNATNFYDCNYLMIQNENFGHKWWFAFITGVEYVNNVTCDIFFEIDVMQSFLFQYRLKDCLVVREHSNTDEVGDNLVLESLELGDIIESDYHTTGLFDKWVAVFFTTFRIEGKMDDDYFIISETDPVATIQNNTPTCASWARFKADVGDNQSEKMTTFIREIQNRSSAVISAIMFPKRFSWDYDPDENTDVKYYPTLAGLAPPTRFYMREESYTPKNYKLFTYPYNYLAVNTGEGRSLTLRYEYFYEGSSDEHKYSTPKRFRFTSMLAPNAQIMCTPVHYKDKEYDFDNEICMENFPQIAWSVTPFAEWLRLNGLGLGVQLAGTVATTAATIATAGLAAPAMGVSAAGAASVGSVAAGSAAGAAAAQSAGTQIGMAAINGTIGVASSLSQMAAAASEPNQSKGKNTVTIDIARRSKDFYFKIMQITPQYAQIIDSFFEMYGYAVYRIKTPNLFDSTLAHKQFEQRKYWYFLQLAQVNYKWIGDETTNKTTSIPQMYINKITQIYQKGITFWNAIPDNNFAALKLVGDYSRDNQPPRLNPVTEVSGNANIYLEYMHGDFSTIDDLNDV